MASTRNGTGYLVRAARITGYDGLNSTHPAKQLVLDHLDELSPAEAVGAVNTVVFTGGRVVGHNTARDRGCQVLDGGRMAVLQAVDTVRLITGHEPDTGRMLRHFDTLTGTTPAGR